MTTTDPVPTQRAVPTADTLLELIQSRQSCRGFEGREVPRSLLEHLAATAQRSPSWCNTQPWQVVITARAATRRFADALVEHACGGPSGSDVPVPAPHTGVHLERRRKAGWQLYGAMGIERGDRAASSRQAAENFQFFGAPHVAILTSPKTQGTYGALDVGVYLGTFMLAAHGMGLATVAQGALAAYAPFVRDHFQIPDDQVFLCGVALGYPDRQHPANQFRTDRADLIEVVRWVDD